MVIIFIAMYLICFLEKLCCSLFFFATALLASTTSNMITSALLEDTVDRANYSYFRTVVFVTN